MKKNLFPVLCGAALLWLGSGCTTPEHGAYLPQNTSKFNQETTAKFVTLDPGAQKSVTCPSIQEGFTADGRLRVAANVRNRENRRIEVQINCAFKDAQGFAVEETPFTTLILTENEIQTVQFEAINTTAKTFTIRVRQSR